MSETATQIFASIGLGVVGGLFFGGLTYLCLNRIYLGRWWSYWAFRPHRPTTPKQEQGDSDASR